MVLKLYQKTKGPLKCVQMRAPILTPGSNQNKCWYKKPVIGIQKLYGNMKETKSMLGFKAPKYHHSDHTCMCVQHCKWTLIFSEYICMLHEISARWLHLSLFHICRSLHEPLLCFNVQRMWEKRLNQL